MWEEEGLHPSASATWPTIPSSSSRVWSKVRIERPLDEAAKGAGLESTPHLSPQVLTRSLMLLSSRVP